MQRKSGMFSLDLTFNEEWNSLKRKCLNSLKLSDFDQVWKALRLVNNDWRSIEGSPTIFTRSHGLKRNSLDKFVENSDYFVGEADLMKFIYMQARYREDFDYLPLFSFHSLRKMGASEVEVLDPNLSKEKSVPSKPISKPEALSARQILAQTIPNQPGFNHGYKVGNKVTVESEDVYCPAEVIAVTSKSIRIHYIGWDTSYDTDLHNFSIVHPGLALVPRIKVWASLSGKIEQWPCVAYIRHAVNNCKDGVDFLKQETRVLVIPAGRELSFIKPYALGKWVTTTSIFPFSMKSFRGKNSANVSAAIESAISELLNDRSSRDLPTMKFIGSYESVTGKELYPPLPISSPVPEHSSSSLKPSSSAKRSADSANITQYEGFSYRKGLIVVGSDDVLQYEKDSTLQHVFQAFSALQDSRGEIKRRKIDTEEDNIECEPTIEHFCKIRSGEGVSSIQAYQPKKWSLVRGKIEDI